MRLPWTATFFPRCCFRSVIALATSLLRSVAFRTDPTARRPAIVRSRFGHAVDVTGKWFVGGRWPVVRPPAPSDRRADRASLSSLVSAASLDLMTVPLPKTHRQSRPGLSLPLARGATAQALVSVRRVVSARAMVDVAPDLARRRKSVTSRRRRGLHAPRSASSRRSRTPGSNVQESRHADSPGPPARGPADRRRATRPNT